MHKSLFLRIAIAGCGRTKKKNITTNLGIPISRFQFFFFLYDKKGVVLARFSLAGIVVRNLASVHRLMGVLCFYESSLKFQKDK